jgi:uncharacterized protein YdhG (YjbR/CyaY superfamily)
VSAPIEVSRRRAIGLPSSDVVAASVDEYIESQPVGVQPRLRELRGILTDALPQATETISYGIPTYRVPGHGRGGFVSFGAAKDHCALYGAPLDTYPHEVSAYSVSKGTIRFPLDRPVPADLVRRLVQAKFRR